MSKFYCYSNSTMDEFLNAVWNIINSSNGIDHELQLAAEARADKAARAYADWLLIHDELALKSSLDMYEADCEYMEALRRTDPTFSCLDGTYMHFMVEYFVNQDA